MAYISKSRDLTTGTYTVIFCQVFHLSLSTCEVIVLREVSENSSGWHAHNYMYAYITLIEVDLLSLFYT